MPRPGAYGALQFGVLLLLGLTRASADVFPVGPGDFSGNETVITFGGLTAGEPVLGTFLGQGVFFGFGLFGAEEANTATNSNGGQPVTPIIVDFLQSPARVGFDVSAPGTALLELIAFDGNGNPADPVPFLIGPTASFVGVELDSGILNLWITEAGVDPYEMQNFRFEALPVPEASSAALAAAAMVGALWLSLGRRRRGGSSLCESPPTNWRSSSQER